ncbi:MAG: hypothetical protein CMI16_09930 [Opitutaceae bacterium]|nr:hypothetical protein [Opitutaceae bacterium]|tara:strand:+ start:74 stop:718 length:645 start_codon:yes stop_codon:yes gene_type:complete
MKLALLSESPADEAGIHFLAEVVLGRKVQRVRPHLRARGWPNVAQVLPPIIKHLHFNTDTDGLIVVVDCDDTVVHTERHEAEGYFHPHCRLCQLRAIFRQTTKRLPAANGRKRVMRCVGLAVPAIEAWYLCGRDDTVTEDAWRLGQESGHLPYTRSELKRRVYGTTRPSLKKSIECAVKEVARHRRDVRRLETDFPGGFGALANDLRDWISQKH